MPERSLPDIHSLDVFLICPVVFKKGADVLKFPVVKCEHIRMYRQDGKTGYGTA